ncbi:hypothetical protein [Polynucleobacter kasalickyi]|uniref:Uncharacterized protein n=1 Tax=Polynucleobacter kasalickyi TaxID=1938817 RepID=A0A1W1Y3W5_9BURK|nr:hypothetical protein [Polynucleobacter kasalickyi]SMC30839.1 hypothetical protein SAMN06296008_101295 [Polynucleobacter kasalickyi]
MKISRVKKIQKSTQRVLFPLRFMWLKLSILLCMSFLLDSCRYPKQPEYWNCHGTNTQVVINKNKNKLEIYEGRQVLMIEIFNQSLSQFAAPATFGRYEICINNSEKVIFKYPNCSSMEDQNGVLKEYQREGVLSKNTGFLFFDEERTLEDKKIISSGAYSCRYLGYRYSYKDMNLESK